MAVKGTADKHGVFTVSSVLYAPPAPQAQLSLPRELPSGTSGRYVALVSGLHLGGGGEATRCPRSCSWTTSAACWGARR